MNIDVMAFTIVDYIILGIMLVFTISGFAKGFLGSLIKIFSGLVSLAIAIWLSSPVATFVNGFVDLTGWFADKISSALQGANALFTYVVGTDLPVGGGTTLDGIALKDAISSDLTTLNGTFKTIINMFISDDAVLSEGTVIGNWLGELLGGVATLIAVAIGLYILIRIAVGILSRIFDAITKNSAIGGLDRLLGLAFGAIKGAAVITILMGIIIAISMVPGINTAVDGYIQSSQLGEPIFNYLLDFVVAQLDRVNLSEILQSALNNIR